MPNILLPSALRTFTNQQASVNVPGKTVQEALSNLAERFPDLRRHVFEETGKLRNFVNVFVGDEDIRHLKQSETPVQEGDTISIVPAVAGGASDDENKNPRETLAV